MKVRIKPNKDRRVLQPHGGFELPKDRATEVEFTAYWQQRMHDGDITVEFQEENVEAVAPAKAEESKNARDQTPRRI